MPEKAALNPPVTKKNKLLPRHRVTLMKDTKMITVQYPNPNALHCMRMQAQITNAKWVKSYPASKEF